MITSKNPVSVSVSREGAARFNVGTCSKTEAGVLIMKHGLKYHPLYQTWIDIRKRCRNKNNKDYSCYGGRGIKICDEWEYDCRAFYDYVTSLPNYGVSGMTLDRINNNGNYQPGNLRWATRLEQVLNRRVKSKSGYTGVAPIKQTGKYGAMVTVRGKKITIGYYTDLIQAATERDMFIIKNGLWEYPLQVIRTHN